MNPKIRLRLLSNIVIVYMLLALAWWSILLFTKNRDAYNAKAELLKIGLIAEGIIANEQEFFKTDVFQELTKEYKRQEWMIMGEASVFVISLIIGIWQINRGYNKEVDAARQGRNFLLSITHELKSPLASIRLVLETLLKRNLPKGKVDQLSKTAIKETDRLNTLVNDLLFSAKLETAYQPHLEPLNLFELVEDLVHKIQAKYPKATIYLHGEASDGLLTGDKEGLFAIVNNLLENAIKYSFDAPEITVSLGRKSAYLTLSISDKGIGIPDKDKKKVFEKFFRVGNEDTRRTKGTGLGLFIVSEIVKAHNGQITIMDNTPQGTIFSIELPAEPMEQPVIVE